MYWKKSFLTLFILGLVTLLTVGCGSTDVGNQTEGGKENGETHSTEQENVLTIAQPTDMVTFDVHDHNTTNTEAIHINLFSYLFKRDANNDIQPHLLETFEVTNDTTWKMKLKDNIKFHNGDQLTSEDVKFTLERIAYDTKLRQNNRYNTIKEVKIIDELNFEIITHEPDPALKSRLSRLGSGMLPKKYIEENGWDHFLKNPVGSGPFQYVDWVRDDRVTLEKFDDYFEGDITEWDKVVFRSIPENSTRVSELLTGGVDIAANIPFTEWDRTNNNQGTSIVSAMSNRVDLIEVNRLPGTPLTDLRVIQAIDLAIDNKALIDYLLGGSGIPVRTRVTPGNFGAHPDLYDTYLYDLEKAKGLLAEAGYADGFELTFAAANKEKEKVQMIAGMLAEIGITAKIELMEWSSYLEMKRANSNPELTFASYANSMFDSALALQRFDSEVVPDRLHYKNEEVDQLLRAAAKNMNFEEREKQYQRAQEIAAEELPYIYLFQEYHNHGVNDRLEYTPRLDGMYYVLDIKKK
jgi:peptide/nickel transport system substrate-binding protein